MEKKTETNTELTGREIMQNSISSTMGKLKL